MIEYYVLYYGTLIFFIFTYIHMYKHLVRNGFLLSMSNIAMVLYIILVGLGGPYIASGALFGRDFSPKLYVLYYSYIIIISVFLIFGNLLGEKAVVPLLKKSKLVYALKGNSSLRLKIFIVVLLILIVFTIYFSTISNIPLLELLKNPTINKSLLAAYRNYITHDMANVYNLQSMGMGSKFALKYWNIFLRYYPTIVLGIFLYFTLVKKIKLYKYLFGLLFIWAFFTAIYNFEKAPVLYLILYVTIVYYIIKKKIPVTKMFLIGVLSFSLIAFMYIEFMGARNIHEAINSALGRIFISQTKASFLHLNTYWSGDFLWGKSYPLMFLDKLFNRETINLSKIAYRDIFSGYYNRYDITGTTGGMNLVNLYINFGYCLGVLIFSLIVSFVGIIDSVLRYLIRIEFHTACTVSLYAFLSIHFSLALVTNINHAFQLPFIFSGGIIAVLLLYIFLIFPVKTKIKQRCHNISLYI